MDRPFRAPTRRDPNPRALPWAGIGVHLWCSKTMISLERGAVVAALQFTDLLFDDLELNRHLVGRLDAVVDGFGIVEFLKSGVNLHELQGDVFAGFTDLGNGSGAVHKKGLMNKVTEVFEFHGEIHTVNDHGLGHFEKDR